MRSLWAFVMFLLFPVLSWGQKEDYQWLVGYSHGAVGDTLFRHTRFDFNFDPVQIRYDTVIRVDMAGANATISDTSGRLIAASNGMVIHGGDGGVLSDKINYSYDLPWSCREWEASYLGTPEDPIPLGLLGNQRILFLPFGPDKVRAVYNSVDECKSYVYRLLTTDINRTWFDGKWKLAGQDKVILKQDSLTYPVHAVRHGNGRDWYVVTISITQSKLFIIYLTAQSSTLVRTVDLPFYHRGSVASFSFSPDGEYLAIYSGQKLVDDMGAAIVLARFDRCDGSVTALKYKYLPTDGIGIGVEFSPDSRYLYAANMQTIFQYDLGAPDVMGSEQVVADFDGFYYNFPGLAINYKVDFWNLRLGPDGKIYVFPASGGQRYMGVMEHPTRPGAEADMRQHSLFLPSIFTRTVPNIPKTRTGPLDGSPCDTLGIDNHPVAKYRYDPDTLDYRRIWFTDLSYFRPEVWSWDFGDGSPRSSERHPRHTYVHNGTYTVCLTVSNENSSNTTCRTLTIGPSGTGDTGPAVMAVISLFPNPVEDYLLVTLGEYIPEHGQMVLYDISGRPVHTQRIYYGQNNVDMTQLAPGIYVWKVMDGQVEIQSGKVVKM